LKAGAAAPLAARPSAFDYNRSAGARMTTPSPFDELIDSVRAALNAKRAELAQRISGIEHALHAYERAVEAEMAAHFSREHGLKQPAPGENAETAALALARLVAKLPELSARAAATKKASAPPPEPEPASTQKPEPRASSGKLVIIGALAGREKSAALPEHEAADAEWIDTERDGVHAVGNLPQRIKQGRVRGVVILDRVVSHKHTEPVIAAAREAQVPVAFAGQGGKASLVRALAQIEEMRRARS